MLRSLFPLALQSALRKRRSSLLTFAVLLISFAAAIVSLSVSDSIRTTNRAFRVENYGAWYLAIPDGRDGDAEWLAQQSWAREVGVSTLSFTSYSGYGVGTIDATAASLCSLSIDGRLPESDGEIAMTRRALIACGAEAAVPGDAVTLDLFAFSGDSVIRLGGSFTLVGVIGDYADLQSFNYNKHNRAMVELALTEADALRPRSGLSTAPVPQYFVGVDDSDHDLAVEQTQNHMRDTRDVTYDDWQPSVNYLSYPAGSVASSADTLYGVLIALVALAAVLCVYIMQLPAEVHSFAVLRSIGITRAQLLVLVLIESALPALPAMALGTLLGAAVTKLTLRLLVYSGSIPVTVSLPFDRLGLLLAMWLLAVVAARLLVCFVAMRTPLTGRMQLLSRDSRRTRVLRRATVALLLAAFGASAVYTAAECFHPAYYRSYYSSLPYYIVAGRSPLSPDLAEQLEQLPGVVRAEGNGNIYDALVDLDGAQVEAKLVEYDARRVEQYARLSSAQQELFARGELMLLYVSADVPLPAQGAARLRVRSGGNTLADVSVNVLPRSLGARERSGLNLSSSAPYQLVCSAEGLRLLLEQSAPGAYWDGIYKTYNQGSFGYFKIEVVVDGNAASLGTAGLVRRLCSAQPESLVVIDQTDQLETFRQDNTQQLILLCACGGCIALVTLLLLAAALSMESEQERRSFTILRVIGMSKKQMRRRIFGKALRRSTLGLALGWAAYLGLLARDELRTGGTVNLAESRLADLVRCGFTGEAAALLSAAVLAVLLAAALAAKRTLRSSTFLS